MITNIFKLKTGKKILMKHIIVRPKRNIDFERLEQLFKKLGLKGMRQSNNLNRKIDDFIKYDKDVSELIKISNKLDAYRFSIRFRIEYFGFSHDLDYERV